MALQVYCFLCCTFLFPGPETWAEHFPAAKGNRQTPIDIIPSWAKYDAKLKEKPLKFKYDPSKCKTILNTGASFQVPMDSMITCEFFINSDT